MSRTEAEIAGLSIGNVAITQPLDTAMEMPAGLPTSLPWQLGIYTALDMLSFVQLLPLFWWEYKRKGAHGLLLGTKCLENTEQKSVGQKTFSSTAKENLFFSPIK